jgi:hypothetical protein
MGNRSRVLSVLLGLLGLWLVCALWMVPAMIESAYRGESWSLVNRMIRGQAMHPVVDYLHDWYRIAAKVTITGLLSGLGFWFAAQVINRQALAQGIRIGYRTVGILTLNILVLLVSLEVAALGVLKIWSLFPQPPEQLVGEGLPREKVSYYASQDWAERNWHEFRLARRQRYYPFVGWRRAPFKGKTIEVDQNGLRVTPGADCHGKAFRVFTFGESTMWGTGSPDWLTISATLQKRLAQLRPGPVCVMNFAESGYATTQDVIMLQMQLRSGNVPDVAVFYSIGGDIGSAYQSGRAGVHADLDNIAARFEGRREPFTVVDQLRKTSAYSLIDQLVGKLTIAHPQQHQPVPGDGELVSYQGRAIDVTKLSDLIVRDYFANYTIVSALAQQYGFKYFFFVPPDVVLGNKPLTSEEQEMKRQMEGDVGLTQLLVAVTQTIERESSKYPNVHSMVHVFDRHESLIFIDGSHVTPIGNQLIAEKMLDVMHLGPQ